MWAAGRQAVSIQFVVSGGNQFANETFGSVHHRSSTASCLMPTQVLSEPAISPPTSYHVISFIISSQLPIGHQLANQIHHTPTRQLQPGFHGSLKFPTKHIRPEDGS